jgi:hypothetical protein
VKHDAKAIALRHIREAEKRIEALTQRIHTLQARKGVTERLERERMAYTELIEVSRRHLHGEHTKHDSAEDKRKMKKDNRRRLGNKGRT